MQKRNTIRIIVLALLVAGTFAVLYAKSASRPHGDKPCNESMEEGCCKKDKSAGSGMIWENISHQFFSTM